MGEKYSTQISILATLILSIYICFFVATFGVSHSPDANLYYSSALKIINGNYLSSIEPMIGPLLPILIAFFSKFQLSLYEAYKFSNIFCIIVILIFSLRLCILFEFSIATIFFNQIACGAVLASFALLEPTPDLLCAMLFFIFVYFLCRLPERKFTNFELIKISFFASLAYYAKALELIIIGLLILCICFFQKDRIKSLLKIFIFYLLFSMPFIALLFVRSGNFIISGQQLLVGKGYAVSKPIWPWLLGYKFENLLTLENSSAKSIVEKYKGLSVFNFDQISLQFNRLYNACTNLIFGEASFIAISLLFFLGVYACFVEKNGKRLIPMVFAFLLHFICYFLIWGPHIRYYIPAIVCFLAISSLGLNFLFKKIKVDNLLGKTFFILVFFIPLQITAKSHAIYNYGPHINFEIAREISREPMLLANKLPLAGNINSAYPGFVSSLLRREYAGSVDPKYLQQSGTKLTDSVCLSEASQLLWVGAKPDFLASEETLSLQKQFKISAINISIYSISKKTC